MAEAMRIDSSGNLLVGTTSTATNDVGHKIFGSTGQTVTTASGTNPVLFNRKTSDGDIAVFRKDDTTVGSIGTYSGTLAINSVNTGIMLDDTNNVLRPTNASGGSRDAIISLGTSSQRFKNLYLSGGAYLGGTGAANKLDDYETGTFTPSFQNGSFTYTSGTSGVYVKVGDLVVININIGWSAKSGSGNLAIVGLPFTAFNLSGMRFTGSLGYTFGLDFAGRELPTVTGSGNTAVMNFFANADNATPVSINVSDCSSSGELQITASYRAI
jgi:hypothetical protein